MAVQGLIATLTTTAVSLAGSGTDHGTIRVIVRNRGTGTAYLGGSTVTTDGFPLTTADPQVELQLQPWDELYGTSTGAAVAQVLRWNETT